MGAIWFPLIAGQACYIRSAIGYRVLTMLGFEPEARLGGLLFRAGPDPRRDVIAFCGKENYGHMHEGQFLGHVGFVSTARRSTSPAANGST